MDVCRNPPVFGSRMCSISVPRCSADATVSNPVSSASLRGRILPFSSTAMRAFGRPARVLSRPLHSVYVCKRSLSDVKHTQSPDPHWTPGQNQPPPFASREWRRFDPATEKNIYPLAISGVVPRCIAFVSSINRQQQANVAPFSYFSVMGHDPPMLAIGLTTRNEVKNHTLKNIEDTGEFVVNIISEWFVESANHCSGLFPEGVDEAEMAGLTHVPSVKIHPPRIAESAFQMECVLHDKVEVRNDAGKHTSTIVIGRVVMFHAHEDICTTDAAGRAVVDFDKLRPVTRLGGDSYGLVREVFSIPRPSKEDVARSLARREH